MTGLLRVSSQAVRRQRALGKKNEVSRGGKEGPVNASEAGPGGWGLTEEPGKPGPRLVPVSLDSLSSEPGPRNVLVDLKQAPNTLTLSPFCPQTWKMWNSRSPRLQRGRLWAPQTHPPRPEATSQRGDLSQMKCSNLVSTTPPSPGRDAPGASFCMALTG